MISKQLWFLILSGFLLYIDLPADAQEFLLPAPAVIPGSQPHDHRFKAGIFDTLDLPFFDDFSRDFGNPDPNLWTDTYTFINNSYPDDPVSRGVATLDAIDNAGNLNGNSDLPFESDWLTSMPLNLDYPSREDTWLSFFYQPEGLGDEPETDDSLVVEFYSPVTDEWKSVWSRPGHSVAPFDQVWIQVTDTSYFHSGFRFRFRNYASLPKSQSFPSYDSNVDHWNIDFVCLDKGRLQTDTAITDVSMISDLPSILKSYESVPWRHFPAAYLTEIKPSVNISYRNNDILTRNVTRFLEIRDIYSGASPYKRSGGAVNVEAGVKDGYEFLFNYPFEENDLDSATFRIKAYLVTDEDDYKWNDTVTRYQEFYNYYSYDDGTAEAGYGISGEGTAGASLAYRFKTYKPDTLRSVKMYFNRSLDNVSQVYFILAVWDHDRNTNKPGDLIYSMTGYRPEYNDELNKFFTYDLDTLLVVSDYFYVGWIQTAPVLLNIGFDRNSDNQENIFYNLGQEWVNTSFHGSLMIRPILGKNPGMPVSSITIPEKEFHVWPNPASDFIYIELPSRNGSKGFNDISNVTVSIYNLLGKVVYQDNLINGSISVQDLAPGMYLIQAETPGFGTFHSRLLIAR